MAINSFEFKSTVNLLRTSKAFVFFFQTGTSAGVGQNRLHSGGGGGGGEILK